MTLGEIDRLTKGYSEAWQVLKERIEALELEKEDIVRKHINGIKNAVNKAKEKMGTLESAILSAPELFEKPRTITMYGVKVGLKKAKGRLEFDDENKTIALIKKHMPEQVDLLINVKETPSKDALQHLSAHELKRIGARIYSTTDEVVVKTTDTDIEKLVEAFMKEDKEAA
ncbi:MAG: hypothetical protein L7F77_11360 [Candidatus Magnetominusculus sp. LBB02]|nr:hypothetical protein [Candidatus Magnetominusculus sp. LBB02]